MLCECQLYFRAECAKAAGEHSHITRSSQDMHVPVGCPGHIYVPLLCPVPEWNSLGIKREDLANRKIWEEGWNRCKDSYIPDYTHWQSFSEFHPAALSLSLVGKNSRETHIMEHLLLNHILNQVLNLKSKTLSLTNCTDRESCVVFTQKCQTKLKHFSGMIFYLQNFMVLLSGATLAK